MAALRFGAMSLVMADTLDLAPARWGLIEGRFWSSSTEDCGTKSGSCLWSSSWISTMVSSEWCSLMCCWRSSTEGNVNKHSAQLKGMVAAGSPARLILSPVLLLFWWLCKCLVRSQYWPKHFRHTVQTYGRNPPWTVDLCFLRYPSLVKPFPHSEQLGWDVSVSPAKVFSASVTSTAPSRVALTFIWSVFSFVSWIAAGSDVSVALCFALWLETSVTLIMAFFLWTSWCLIKPDAWLKLLLHCVQQYGRLFEWTQSLCLLRWGSCLKIFPQSPHVLDSAESTDNTDRDAAASPESAVEAGLSGSAASAGVVQAAWGWRWMKSVCRWRKASVVKDSGQWEHRKIWCVAFVLLSRI